MIPNNFHIYSDIATLLGLINNILFPSIYVSGNPFDTNGLEDLIYERGS